MLGSVRSYSRLFQLVLMRNTSDVLVDWTVVCNFSNKQANVMGYKTLYHSATGVGEGPSWHLGLEQIKLSTN